jgi:hypothetical protein
MSIQGPAIAFSAALLLIFADISHFEQSQGLNIVPYLSVCFRALDEFGQSWESAKRARDFLTKLQRQWELLARPRRSVRRNMGFTKTVSNGSRKRPLAATDFGADRNGSRATWPRQQQQAMQDNHSDDAIGFDFDMDYDWMLEANVQSASGTWATFPSSAPAFGFDGNFRDV